MDVFGLVSEWSKLINIIFTENLPASMIALNFREHIQAWLTQSLKHSPVFYIGKKKCWYFSFISVEILYFKVQCNSCEEG